MKDAHYKDKVVVITGGSSGIGLALAKEFAKQQAQLVLIARNKEKLAAAASVVNQFNPPGILTYSADVSDREAITAVVNEAGTKLGKIDVVINNAGITSCGRFADQPAENLEKCLSVNYLGAVYTSKAAWAWLRQSGGQLSFVSSVAGYIGLIGYSGYSPPKFALTGLAESLRMEAKADGICVSVIYPPDTDTPMFAYEKLHGLPETAALSKNIKAISAERVAKVYINGLMKNKFEIYCDFNSRFVRWVKNNFPGLFRRITDNISQRSGNH